MTKVTYRFDLDNPDDQEKLKIFQQAENMSRVMWEFTHNTKRIACNLDEKQYEGFEIAMNRFHSLLEQYGVVRE